MAIISGSREARTYDLDLGFLGEGEWDVLASTDVLGEPWPLQIITGKVSAEQTIEVKLPRAGAAGELALAADRRSAEN